MQTITSLARVLIVLVLLVGAAGCRPGSPQTPEQAHENEVDEMPSLSPVGLGEGEWLRVVATTSIVADVVRNVGGDYIELTTLLPLGSDPHAFEPTPQDVATVSEAHVVFANGAGLEAFLDRLLESAGERTPVVPVSYGVQLLTFEDDHDDERGGSADPHTWLDPNNVIEWTGNIQRALTFLDPANAGTYEANAAEYEAQLKALDVWIREQIDRIPAPNRRLVTDHKGFGYFARRYGFDQVGAVFPGYSTLAEPSARDLADLEDAIESQGIRAIFASFASSPDLVERVAEDTGTQLVFVYTGSLSEPGGPAADYISFMKYDVNAIVDALQ